MIKCDQWPIVNASQTWSFTRWCSQWCRKRMCKSVDCHYNWFQLFNPWGAGRKGEPVFQESISHKLYNRVYIHVHEYMSLQIYGWSVAYQFPTYYKDNFTPAWAALLTACLVIVDIIGQPPDLPHHRQQTCATDIDLWVEQSPQSSSVGGLPLPGFTTNCASGRCPVVKAGHRLCRTERRTAHDLMSQTLPMVGYP